MDLRENELSGTIPLGLSRLTRLESLDLRENEFSGTIPSELSRLTRLRDLDLRGNQLSGAIPSALSSLTRLESLDLRENELSGTIPPGLSRLTQLRDLNLRANQLSGAIPTQLSSLTRLEALDLRENELSGTIPSGLRRLRDLEHLYLAGNRLSGTVPSRLSSLTNLEVLDLGFNRELTGMIPSELRRLPLSTLRLMATSVCVPNDAPFQEWLSTIEFLPSGCGRPAAEQSEIDIAVFYTRAARRSVGSSEGIEAMIGLWVAETNQVYVDSGVNQRLILIAVKEVAYAESGGCDEVLDHLAGASDGHMDGIHSIRDQLGADLVHLIPAEVPGCTGIAQRPGEFGLTELDGGALTFAHEVGHNMGLSHDRYVADGSGSLPYSFGYVNQRALADGAPERAGWHTIMAYDDQCRNAGVRCEHIPHFSNPDRTYLGDPLGVHGEARLAGVAGPANASRTLNITRHSVEAFRVKKSASASQARKEVSSATRAGPGAIPRALSPVGRIFSPLASPVRSLRPRRATASHSPETLRRREVSVNIETLERVSSTGPTAVTLNLFEDTAMTAVMERTTPVGSGLAFFGRLLGIEEGTVTLFVNGEVVAATARMPGALYRIGPAGAKSHTIAQVDSSQLPLSCGTE